jgi:hypothetical protein
MNRSGRRLAPAASALALALVTACQPAPTSPPPATEHPTPRPTPTAVPTPLVSPAPSATPGTAPAELVVRVTRCAEICEPSPGTTVLADGRMVWQTTEGRVVEATLTAEALRQVRDDVAGRAELQADGDFQAELRPGAQPFPRGTSVFRFDVGPGEPIVVTSGDPADYAAEPELWDIPPQMERLARLARRLLEPVAWLGPDALAEPPSPYRPARYLLLIEHYPDIGELPGFGIDVAEVESPFGAPLEAVGQPVPQPDDTFPVHCLVTDADTARRLAAAEAAAGARRDPGQWSSAIAYDWRRGGGFIQVTLTQVLPYQADPCGELDLG